MCCYHILDIFDISIIIARVVRREGADLRRASGIGPAAAIYTASLGHIRKNIYYYSIYQHYLLHNLSCFSPCLCPTIFLLNPVRAPYIRSLRRQDLTMGSHTESNSSSTSHAVSMARLNHEVYTTSNSIPCRFNNLPAFCASRRPSAAN